METTHHHRRRRRRDDLEYGLAPRGFRASILVITAVLYGGFVVLVATASSSYQPTVLGFPTWIAVGVAAQLIMIVLTVGYAIWWSKIVQGQTSTSDHADIDRSDGGDEA